MDNEEIKALMDEIDSAEFCLAFWQNKEHEAKEVVVNASRRLAILQERLAAELSQQVSA